MPGFSALIKDWANENKVITRRQVGYYLNDLQRFLTPEQMQTVINDQMTSHALIEILKQSHYGDYVDKILSEPEIPQKHKFHPKQWARRMWGFFTTKYNQGQVIQFWKEFGQEIFMFSKSLKQNNKFFKSRGMIYFDIFICYCYLMYHYRQQLLLPDFYFLGIECKQTTNSCTTHLLTDVFFYNLKYFMDTNQSIPIILYIELADDINREGHGIFELYVPYKDQDRDDQIYYKSITIDTSAASRKTDKYIHYYQLSQKSIDQSLQTVMKKVNINYEISIYNHSCSYNFQNYGTCTIFSTLLTFKMLYSFDHPDFWENVNDWCRGFLIPLYIISKPDQNKPNIQVLYTHFLEKQAKRLNWIMANLVKFLVFRSISEAKFKELIVKPDENLKKQLAFRNKQFQLLTTLYENLKNFRLNANSSVEKHLLENCKIKIKDILAISDQWTAKRFVTKARHDPNYLVKTPLREVESRKVNYQDETADSGDESSVTEIDDVE